MPCWSVPHLDLHGTGSLPSPNHGAHRLGSNKPQKIDRAPREMIDGILQRNRFVIERGNWRLAELLKGLHQLSERSGRGEIEEAVMLFEDVADQARLARNSSEHSPNVPGREMTSGTRGQGKKHS